MEEKIKITGDELLNIGFEKKDSNFIIQFSDDDTLFDDERELILTYYGSVNGSDKGYVINFDFEGRRLKYMHEVKELILELKQLNNEQQKNSSKL